MNRDELLKTMRAAWKQSRLSDREGDDEVLDGVYASGAARVALDAVEPLIRADELRQAAGLFAQNQMIRQGDVKEWLRLRADDRERSAIRDELYAERLRRAAVLEHRARCQRAKCEGGNLCRADATEAAR